LERPPNRSYSSLVYTPLSESSRRQPSLGPPPKRSCLKRKGQRRGQRGRERERQAKERRAQATPERRERRERGEDRDKEGHEEEEAGYR
jgi:hypothetical protein